MDITERIDQYLMDTDNVNEMKLTGQAKTDWNKVVKVIKSIDDPKQLEAARNLIKNFIKLHGKDSGHNLLELELKSVSRRLK